MACGMTATTLEAMRLRACRFRDAGACPSVIRFNSSCFMVCDNNLRCSSSGSSTTAASHLLFVLLPDSCSFPPAAEGRPEVTVAQRAHSCGQPGLEQLVVLGVLLPGLKS